MRVEDYPACMGAQEADIVTMCEFGERRNFQYV
jgi:hypothetical protein